MAATPPSDASSTSISGPGKPRSAAGSVSDGTGIGRAVVLVEVDVVEVDDEVDDEVVDDDVEVELEVEMAAFDAAAGDGTVVGEVMTVRGGGGGTGASVSVVGGAAEVVVGAVVLGAVVLEGSAWSARTG